MASQSPRRLELLQHLDLQVQVEPPYLEEIPLSGEAPEAYVLRMARMKAENIAQRFPQGLILSADTAVVLGEKIFGKPADAHEAEAMLVQLSGKVHQVLTGVVLFSPAQAWLQTGVAETLVKMCRLSLTEIRHYIATGEPLDKAGAYAIQGAGGRLIDAIYGSYTNVIGLPLPMVKLWLTQFYAENPL